MLSIYRSAAALSAVTLLTALLTQADPVALTVTGLVTTSNMNNAQLGAGSYTLQDLSNVGVAVGTVSSGGLTGVPLWSLLGGTAAGTSDVLTPTPAGDNAKNAILRSYFLATTVTGMQSIISAGEIDPFFGGTATVPDFIAFSGTDGKPELVLPDATASGRNVVDLASLQVLAAPASPNGPGGTSSSFTLAGNVARPGSYNLASLQSFPPTSETVSGDTYTGVALWNLLNVTGNIQNQYVIATGTDGYESVYSLAELDPALGAPLDLVPYADNAGQFPADGFARIIIPGDNHQGRYISNLTSIDVVAVPEPAALPLLAAPLLALYLSKRRLPID